MLTLYKIREGDSLLELDPIILESVKSALSVDDQDFPDHLLRHSTSLFSTHQLYQQICRNPAELKVMFGSCYGNRKPDLKIVSESPIPSGSIRLSILEIIAYVSRREKLNTVDGIFSLLPKSIPLTDRFASASLAMIMSNNIVKFPTLTERYERQNLASISEMIRSLGDEIKEVGFYESLTRPWMEYYSDKLRGFSVNLDNTKNVQFTGYARAYIAQDQIGEQSPSLSTAFISDMHILDARRALVQVY